MLFSDLLEAKTVVLEPEFHKLFLAILENQTHDGDLLFTATAYFYN